MSIVYLLTGLNNVADDETKHFLNARSEVEDWISFANFGYLIKSSSTAQELSTGLATYLKKNGHPQTPIYLISRVPDVGGDIQGFLPKALWKFLGLSAAEPTSTARTNELPHYEFTDGDEEVPF
jgi:hypothetical protein